MTKNDLLKREAAAASRAFAITLAQAKHQIATAAPLRRALRERPWSAVGAVSLAGLAIGVWLAMRRRKTGVEAAPGNGHMHASGGLLSSLTGIARIASQVLARMV